MSKRYTENEIAYLKHLSGIHIAHSLKRLARLASKQLDRSEIGIYSKLEKMSADGDLWR